MKQVSAISRMCNPRIATFSAFKFLFFLCWWATQNFEIAAYAANIKVFEKNGCQILLSGEIESGDYEKFVAVRTPEKFGTTFGPYLCLNSLGGSFSEALKFLKSELIFGTRIISKHKCISACSLIFLAGKDSSGFGNRTFPNKSMEAAATLAFHAPGINFSEGVYQKEYVSAVWEVSRNIIAELMKLNLVEYVQGHPYITSELLYNIFNTSSKNLYYIDEVYKAVVNDIPVEIKNDGWLSDKEIRNVCRNYSLYRWKEFLVNPSATKDRNSRFEEFIIAQEAAHGKDEVFSEKKVRVSQEKLVQHAVHGRYFHPRYITNGGWRYCIVKNLIENRESTIQVTLQPYGVLFDHIDEAEKISLEKWNEAKFDQLEPLTVAPILRYHPRQSLAQLTPLSSTKPTIGTQSGSSFHFSKNRCIVRTQSKEVLDDDPCKIEILDANELGLGDGTVLNFLWPSGAKTVLVFADGKVKLNGIPTEHQNRTGFEGCYFNSKSGNEFCYTK